MQVGILAIIFFYLTYYVELSSRHAFCVATGQPGHLQEELQNRMTHPFRMFGEVLLAFLILLNIMTVFNHFRYMSFPLLFQVVK